jgi:hypothetical protein
MRYERYRRALFALGDASSADSFPPGCGSGGTCDWAVYCRANPTLCNAAGTGLKARAVLLPVPIARPVQPLPNRPASRALAEQLIALDNAGTATRNDHNCITTGTQRVYTWGCERAHELAPMAVFDAAKEALARLEAVSLPPWSEPERRWRYYSLVLDYVWIMIWAGNFAGDKGLIGVSGPSPGQIPLCNATHWNVPSPLPDYGSGVGREYWGPGPQDLLLGDRLHVWNDGADPRNVWACDNLINGGTPVMDSGVETGRKFTVRGAQVFATTGYHLCQYAQSVANYFSNLSFFRFQADGLQRYANYVAAWPKEWGDASSLVSATTRAAADANTLADVQADATATISIATAAAAAIANVVPVFGQIASVVLGVISLLVGLLKVDTGVHCPRPCSYRILANTDCPPTPATPPGPLFTPPTLPGTGSTPKPKSSVPTAALVVGGAVALGLLVFWPKK